MKRWFALGASSLLLGACQQAPPTCDVLSSPERFEGSTIELVGAVSERRQDGSVWFTGCHPPRSLPLRWRSGVDWRPGSGDASPVIKVTGVIVRSGQSAVPHWNIDAIRYREIPLAE